MESDDDYQQFSTQEEPSSPIHQRKLKRLKKADRVPDVSIPQLVDPIPSPNTINSPTKSSKPSSVEDPVDSVPTMTESEGLDSGRDLDTELDDLFTYRDSVQDQTVLNVEGEDPCEISKAIEEEEIMGEAGEGGQRFGDEDIKSAKKRRSSKEVGEWKEKKKRSKKTGKSVDDKENVGGEEKKRKSKKTVKNIDDKEYSGEEEKKQKSRKTSKSVGNKENPEAAARAKRKLEKERKAHLEQLHAESQRLLRETRDATFKPVPLVQKPISSILEKIRQRKLEVSKKTSMLNNHVETNDFTSDVVIDLYPEQVNNDNVVDKKQTEEVEKDIPVNEESNTVDETLIESSSGPASVPSPSEKTSPNTDLDQESKTVFRALIDDTQDLFDDTQESDGEDLDDSQEDTPVEEVFEPSVLTMNLKLDSAPPDDISSEEENDDKENVDPRPCELIDREPPRKEDPVKAFLDDEAEEEDDSDNDMMRFKENEDDDENEENEEFNDLIVTGFKENPSDNVKRDQLHQMWLEQQDAAATDDVLQRLKYGGKQHREPTALEVEEDDASSGDDSMDDDADHHLPTSVARINTKKMRQMIPQMFTDKDDVFLSSDDEETEQKLVKMRLLEKAEEHASFLSPAEDEHSRGVFGLIKKVNIAPEPKRNTKSSSFLETLLTGGNSSSSSKSSFLGHAPSSSLPSSNKSGSTNFRSFIFGRDDSNSRSAITPSEASSDIGENSNLPTKSASAKFSGSQNKFSSQKKTHTTSSSSLLEILRKSTQSDNCARTTTVGQTQVAVQFAAFKSAKKSTKIEARN